MILIGLLLTGIVVLLTGGPEETLAWLRYIMQAGKLPDLQQ